MQKSSKNRQSARPKQRKNNPAGFATA